jgi:arsenite methyltransferase
MAPYTASSETGADLKVHVQAGSAGCCSAEPAVSCCDASSGVVAASSKEVSVHDGLAQILHNFDANAYAASVRVYATVGSHSVPPEHTSRSGDVVSLGTQQKVSTMKTIQIYDKPMCCSTGICGPQVDPVLPRFAADLDALRNAGHTVERYNLSQQPQAFIQNTQIHALLSTKGTEVLPVVMVDGHVVSRGIYPSREMLDMWADALPLAQKGN